MEGKWKQAGEKLKEIRKKTSLSVFKVAKKTHISGSYLSMLERGINCPSDTVLFNMAEFYQVNPADLFKLYDRVIPPTNEQLNAVPSLKKIITQISIDPKLSATEKEAFAEQLYKIANDIITKE